MVSDVDLPFSITHFVQFRLNSSDELLLYDDEFFENGDDIDTAEFDAVDTFLAESFVECMKSPDDTYHMVRTSSLVIAAACVL